LKLKKLQGVFISLYPMTKTSTLSAETWFELIRLEFVQHANFLKAKGMQKYMKDLFSFYGIDSPTRRQLLKVIISKEGKPDPQTIRDLAILLWQAEEREMQYAAMDLLDPIKKKPFESDLPLIEKLITTKCWWDTVDALASHLAGNWFLKFPENKENILDSWYQSGNMWLQRTVLIHQLNYKDKTDEKLLFFYCDQLKESKEFFIRKGIGWALRQYARTAPDKVRTFVNQTTLSALSVREATKHL
jgi:3-methyladenine DNA glycosylase AlkD